MSQEIRLMKGNEAIAEAAIRSGVDAYFGYPITPQSEIIEYLAAEDPFNKRSGMVVLQAESELAAINMVYGAAACGKKAMTSSASPGMSLKQEAISFLAGADLPCLIVNVSRGGPGLGTIQPSQADYFQAVKGGGHGDYHMIVLAPASVQEQYDFVEEGFRLAFKYRTPVMMLSDGAMGQMMERVVLNPETPRTEQNCDWALTGKTPDRDRNYITSLYLAAERQEQRNVELQDKYVEITKNEIRYEEYRCEDADYLFVAYGVSARICIKVIEIARLEGIKVGLLRPITLWPFPSDIIAHHAAKIKGIQVLEMSAGQMVEDVRLAVNGKVPVKHYGRMGGIIASPDEVLRIFKQNFLS